ncbi:hypothetical protein [Cobetia crustatorum]|uniref:Uncharacterized protein n=1 Tax=Cobetia crustatorum TaxID=553385 RepID=A0A558HDQ1_9GAMM|nr:hypothetical protein [Cobetia crustatorum]TVU67214.1 hypothetical protein FQP86_17380 [Cobetia crustatorum]
MQFILSIIAGVVSGFISGWLMMHYSEYRSLRDEVLEYIRSIDYMAEGSVVVFTYPSGAKPLILLSSALRWKGHNGISNTINKIDKCLKKYEMPSSADYKEIDGFMQKSQENIRVARPNFSGLFFGRNISFKKFSK